MVVLENNQEEKVVKSLISGPTINMTSIEQLILENVCILMIRRGNKFSQYDVYGTS